MFYVVICLFNFVGNAMKLLNLRFTNGFLDDFVLYEILSTAILTSGHVEL